MASLAPSAVGNYSTASLKKSYVCPKCGHKHQDSIACHCFIWVPDDETSSSSSVYISSDEGTISGSEVEEEDEDDGDGNSENSGEGDGEGGGGIMGGLMAMARMGKAAAAKIKDLTTDKHYTPYWAVKCGFQRCNCNIGVPVGDKRFQPVAKERFAGLNLPRYEGVPIRINQEGYVHL